jgi:hypothetical protein
MTGQLYQKLDYFPAFLAFFFGAFLWSGGVASILRNTSVSDGIGCGCLSGLFMGASYG